MGAPTFEPPGPGVWTLDTGRFPRPATPFTAEAFPQPAREGFAAATAPYGLLLRLVEWRFVNGWAYLSPQPVAPLATSPPADREQWDALMAAHPALSERVATSATVFERRPWRDELALWDGGLKPAVIATHRRIQALDPERLDDQQLATHLDRCRDQLRRAIAVHHRFNVAPVIPVGDLLVAGQGWTGASPVELLALLRTSDRLAAGSAAAVAELAHAVSGDPTTRALLDRSDRDAAQAVAELRARPGAVGRAAAAYLDLVGYWISGSGTDVGEPYLLELPDLLLAPVRAAAADGSDSRGGDDERADSFRAAVPRPHREAFDELLTQARAVHRLRDERAVFCDVWANGLTRRAILAAGRRLADRGRVERPDHLVEASHAEIRGLLAGGRGPSGLELAERARDRRQSTPDGVPEVIGGPPRTPVPTDWLPPGAARTERAFRTYLAAMSQVEPPPTRATATLQGTGASRGLYEGRARVVRGTAELARVQPGDVLVAEATTPAHTVVLSVVGAVVTDRGGLLSHAASIAREYRIPAVVGTGDATRSIPDGATVRVDGDSGEVAVVAPPPGDVVT